MAYGKPISILRFNAAQYLCWYALATSLSRLPHLQPCTVYSSLKTAASQNYISYSTLARHTSQGKTEFESAGYWWLALGAIGYGCKIRIQRSDGNKYRSLQKAAKASGLDVSALSKYTGRGETKFNCGGYAWEVLPPEPRRARPVNQRHSSKRKPIVCVTTKTEYPSLLKAADALHLTSQALTWHVNQGKEEFECCGYEWRVPG